MVLSSPIVTQGERSIVTGEDFVEGKGIEQILKEMDEFLLAQLLADHGSSTDVC